jgi:hypothetical protein
VVKLQVPVHMFLNTNQRELRLESRIHHLKVQEKMPREDLTGKSFS